MSRAHERHRRQYGAIVASISAIGSPTDVLDALAVLTHRRTGAVTRDSGVSSVATELRPFCRDSSSVACRASRLRTV